MANSRRRGVLECSLDLSFQKLKRLSLWGARCLITPYVHVFHFQTDTHHVCLLILPPRNLLQGVPFLERYLQMTGSWSAAEEMGNAFTFTRLPKAAQERGNFEKKTTDCGYVHGLLPLERRGRICRLPERSRRGGEGLRLPMRGNNIIVQRMVLSMSWPSSALQHRRVLAQKDDAPHFPHLFRPAVFLVQ